MNQILSYKNSNVKKQSLYEKNKQYKMKKRFYIIFFAAIFIFIILFVYFCYYIYNISLKEKKAKELAQSFSVKTIYNNDLSYSASTINNSGNKSTSFIIGLIEIDKIGLHYPILSSSSEANLKIAPCRFAGPLPNEVGNLCIAGHNYIDNSFFGKLRLLDIDDKVKIYDLQGNVVNYSIFYKTEVENTDFKYTSQNTKGNRIVTLMTCNSLKDTRLMYLAKEIS